MEALCYVTCKEAEKEEEEELRLFLEPLTLLQDLPRQLNQEADRKWKRPNRKWNLPEQTGNRKWGQTDRLLTEQESVWRTPWLLQQQQLQ